MSDKQKKDTQMGKKGMKLYLTAEEERHARAVAKKLGYQSVQLYLRDKLRQERIDAKAEK